MSAPSVIVTGSSRGIGLAAARELAAQGANVVLFARSADALEAASRQLPGSTLAISGDIASARDRSRLVEGTLYAFGGITAVVNNAAILAPLGPIADVSPEEWDEALSINVTGAAALVGLAADALRQSEGRVINVSSGAAVTPIQGAGVYSVTKAALKMWTEVLAAEEPSITSIAVRPGVVATAMQETIRGEGAARLPTETYRRFVAYHEDGALLDPSIPGQVIAALALAAPHEWSGEQLNWNDPKVLALAGQ